MNKLLLLVTCVVIFLSGCATTPVLSSIPPARATDESAGKSVPSGTEVSKNPELLATTTPRGENPSISTSPSSIIETLTLDEALRMAEANRSELEALRHRIGMAGGEAQQAGLWPNPKLSLGVEGYTPNGDRRPPDLSALENAANVINQTQGTALWVPSIPEPRHPDQRQQVVSITQPLPIWGTPRLARKAGLLEMERWRHEYERTKLELHSQVKKAFDDVLFQQEMLATTADLERTLVEILDATRARLEAGDIAEVELIKGEADHERFALEVEAARSGLSQAKMRLARVLGNPNLSVQSCAGAAAPELPDLPDSILAKLREDHPQVKVWEAAEDAAKAQVSVAESRRWPVPTLGAGYRHYEFTDQDTFDVSFEFELPVFDRRQGEIRAAREKVKYEAASLQAERNNLEAILGQTIAGYTSHRRRAEAFQQRILPKMEETWSIARARFEAGDTSMLEVLDAYRALAEARRAYLREAFETRSAYYGLEYLLFPSTR